MGIFGRGGHLEPAAVRAGLASTDDETRLAAAEDLRQLPLDEGVEAGFACLLDPVFEIRVEGLKRLNFHLAAFVKVIHPVRLRLAMILAQDDEANRVMRDNVLNDLPNLEGPLRDQMAFVVAVALSKTTDREIALELLEELVELKKLKYVAAGRFLPDADDGATKLGLPARCCRCGTEDATASLDYALSEMGGAGAMLHWSKMRLGLPVCAACAGVGKKDILCKLIPGRSPALVLVVPSPEFIVDLLVPGHAWKLQVPEWTELWLV